MDLLNNFPKEVQVLILLSPFFIGIFVLAFLLRKADKKAQKYRIYWLLLSIIGFSLGIYDLLQSFIIDKPIYYRSFMLITGAAYCFDRYRLKRKK